MGAEIRSHHDLKVWQLGMELAEAIYSITAEFPREEVYGLTSQLRRAAASVPANVAEGNGRHSTREFARHVSIAIGSLWRSRRSSNSRPVCIKVMAIALNARARFSLRKVACYAAFRNRYSQNSHRLPRTNH